MAEESPVECPVCTLYLRKDISLHDHLNTHPKDQVIDALIRCSNGSEGLLINHVSKPRPTEDTQSQHVQIPDTFVAPPPPMLHHFMSMPSSMSGLPCQANSNQMMPLLYTYPVNSASHPGPEDPLRFYISQVNPSPYLVPVGIVPTPGTRTPPAAIVNPLQTSPTSAETEATVSARREDACVSHTATSVTVSLTRTSTADASVSTPFSGVNCDQDDDEDDGQMSDGQADNFMEVYMTNKDDESGDQSCEEGLERNECDTTTSAKQALSHIVSPETEDISIVPDICESQYETIQSTQTYTSSEQKHNTDSTMCHVADVSDASEVCKVQYSKACVNNDSASVTAISDISDVCEVQYSKFDSLRESNKNANASHESLDADIVTFETAGPTKIIEISGIHIVVPSQLLENNEVLETLSAVPHARILDCDDREAHKVDGLSVVGERQTSKTISGSLSVTEGFKDSTGQKEPVDFFKTVPVKIVEDQNQQQYLQVFVDDFLPTSSNLIDLHAQETWDASDLSDSEEQKMTRPPPPPPPKWHSPPRYPRVSPRVYHCRQCKEVFSCPKERRVHVKFHHRVDFEDAEKDTTFGSEVEKSSSGICSESDVGLPPPLSKASKSVEESISQCEQQNEQDVKLVMSPDANSLSFPEEASDVISEEPCHSGVPCASETKEEKCELKLDKHSCPECNSFFPTAKALSSHKKVVHADTSSLTCKNCSSVFPSVSLLRNHMKTHPVDTTFECMLCGKCFRLRQNLKLHLRRHLGDKPHKCTACDKGFITRQKLDEHMNSHTGNAPVKCNLCSKTFRRYSNLIQHKNRHHLNVKKKVKDFFCQCGEILHSKKKLNWHKEIHDPKPKSCTFCSQKFVHMASLTRHIRQMHDTRYVPKDSKGDDNVECTICRGVYKKSSLQIHMRVHSGERPFKCDICSKGFTTKWNLQLHRWIHMSRSVKPFKCNLCKNAYFRQGDLLAHTRSHKNVRPYTCNYCGGQFIRHYNFRRHVKEHETEKSHVCTACGKSFHRSYYLKEHLRVHTGQRPFACHICGKASSTKSNHNKHVRIHHAREPVNTEH